MDSMHTAQDSNVPLIPQLLLCFLRASISLPLQSRGRERRKEADEAWSVAHSSSIKARDGALRAFFLLQ
ncbi:hypothetical protein C4D60_Mb01t28720 [Musa balbisiana]|uniref:Uncharacterized protein n=1 Tax=Musa balbisiana TaxID=52838 RepID=A0A4S8JRF8_MUSBA|nr:hypothetical protein C4D60_Mb01t28720 [Musa balbisiana]